MMNLTDAIHCAVKVKANHAKDIPADAALKLLEEIDRLRDKVVTLQVEIEDLEAKHVGNNGGG